MKKNAVKKIMFFLVAAGLMVSMSGCRGITKGADKAYEEAVNLGKTKTNYAVDAKSEQENKVKHNTEE